MRSLRIYNNLNPYGLYRDTYERIKTISPYSYEMRDRGVDAFIYGIFSYTICDTMRFYLIHHDLITYIPGPTLSTIPSPDNQNTSAPRCFGAEDTTTTYHKRERY